MTFVPDEWVARPITRFDTIVGPFYFPANGEERLIGFVADERHANRRGVVHGGVITTAFDVALGTAHRHLIGDKGHATIQLNVHFVGAMHLGDFATIRSEIIRATRSVTFLRGVMTVGDRVVATADGIWKLIR